MKRELLSFALMLLGTLGMSQTCPTITSPMNGDTNVPVETSISWDAVPGVTGYIISLGTTPGGTDIIDNRAVGSATTYAPPTGLPESEDIYVTITLFFFDREDISCPSELFSTEDVTIAPDCAVINTPADEAVDVNQGAVVSWSYVPKATGYSINIGTSEGGGELVPTQDLGNVLSFDPPGDLPLETEIFVQIIPRNENGAAPTTCPVFSFTTGELAELPGCTSLISPANGAINVPLTPLLEWTPVPGATGYRVSIGSTPTENDVGDNLPFSESSTFVIDFEPNKTFYITIIPYNDAGEAIGCTQQSFSTILGCGPFIDQDTGELVNLAPAIDFPETISICQNELPFVVQTEDVAVGFRWFRLNGSGFETLISDTSEVSLDQDGDYRYEAYNTTSQSTNTIECVSSQEFTLVSSEIATITAVDVAGGQNGTIQVTVQATGSGDYEYAIGDRNGPYQDSNMFLNVAFGSYSVYVRDKNGCGIAEDRFDQNLTVDGFPKFFTPNGDGINDFWQYIPPLATGEINVRDIFIFDRYGNFLGQINPTSRGWDGNLNGLPLPSTDYWFKAIGLQDEEIQGHFTLKR